MKEVNSTEVSKSRRLVKHGGYYRKEVSKSQMLVKDGG